jgi:hypothetical protein
VIVPNIIADAIVVKDGAASDAAFILTTIVSFVLLCCFFLFSEFD